MSRPIRKGMLKVIVDSNALFVPFQFKIDVFSELEQLLNRRFSLILLSSVKRELETLAEKGSPKMRKNAAYALKLGEKCTYVNVGDHENLQVDDVIVETAEKGRTPV